MKPNKFAIGDQVRLTTDQMYKGSKQGAWRKDWIGTVTELSSRDNQGKITSEDGPHVILNKSQWVDESCLELLVDPGIDQAIADLFGILPAKEVVVEAIETIDHEGGWDNITRREAEAIAEAVLGLPWPKRKD